ncbi:hypothetical protein F4859DRAFT_467379 [Xylaria cf. heliscus]|nr:hypothetical protein F4859DRAFT_467379 [Xylaria cf. heliscus]
MKHEDGNMNPTNTKHSRISSPIRRGCDARCIGLLFMSQSVTASPGPHKYPMPFTPFTPFTGIENMRTAYMDTSWLVDGTPTTESAASCHQFSLEPSLRYAMTCANMYDMCKTPYTWSTGMRGSRRKEPRVASFRPRSRLFLLQVALANYLVAKASWDGIYMCLGKIAVTWTVFTTAALVLDVQASVPAARDLMQSLTGSSMRTSAVRIRKSVRLAKGEVGRDNGFRDGTCENV